MNQIKIKNGWRIFACCFLLSAFTLPFTPGCGSLKPVPVEEGQDAVVVNAERIQQSSIEIYGQVTSWEMAHRESLPKEVSRAVDKFRKGFPPAWRLSRKALVEYKEKRGTNTTDLAKATAALSAAQTALLTLRDDQSDNAIAAANNSITSLIASFQSLFQRKPTP